jgi:hypothetical protein
MKETYTYTATSPTTVYRAQYVRSCVDVTVVTVTGAPLVTQKAVSTVVPTTTQTAVDTQVASSTLVETVTRKSTTVDGTRVKTEVSTSLKTSTLVPGTTFSAVSTDLPTTTLVETVVGVRPTTTETVTQSCTSPLTYVATPADPVFTYTRVKR